MKINLVSVENSLIALGFRTVVSLTKAPYPETNSYFIPLDYVPIWRKFLFPPELVDNILSTIEEIVSEIANADIIGFSSMSDNAPFVRELCKAVKRISPKTYIVWGGVHGVIEPEDAIKYADAVCTGEGEVAFIEFLKMFEHEKDYIHTKNFWFNHNGKIVKNDFLPLHTNEELDQFTLLEYAGGNERIYLRNKGFQPVTTNHYITLNSLGYNTIWSIGCPFSCSYCGNTKFIDNDKNYRKVRHPTVDYIVREIEYAKNKHPFINSIVFNDDSFMALPLGVLEEFSIKYRDRIDIPFSVIGVIPNYVNEDKFKLLVSAGMIRVRMGIQSGSTKMLNFYKRPGLPKTRDRATRIINQFKSYMVIPSYDIILDNPIETTSDVHATLNMLYDMPRPFTVNPFSLRVMPNTNIEKQFKELNISHKDMTSNFLYLSPTIANALIYVLAIFKPPRLIFDYLLQRSLPYHQEQEKYPSTHQVLRFLWLFRRAMSHLRFMDFPYLPGKVGIVLYRIGFLKFWKRFFVKKYRIPKRRWFKT